MSTHATAPTKQIDPMDYLEIDTLLSDEERLIRDTVRGWVREHIVPNVGEWFEEGILPMELAPELGKLGLLGMHLDGYGLPGASAVAYGLACLELEAGDSRHAQPRLGAGFAVDVRDLALGLRGAEAAVAAADGERARSSAASASPSRTPVPTPARCARTRGATARTGS